MIFSHIQPQQSSQALTFWEQHPLSPSHCLQSMPRCREQKSSLWSPKISDLLVRLTTGLCFQVARLNWQFDLWSHRRGQHYVIIGKSASDRLAQPWSSCTMNIPSYPRIMAKQCELLDISLPCHLVSSLISGLAVAGWGWQPSLLTWRHFRQVASGNLYAFSVECVSWQLLRRNMYRQVTTSTPLHAWMVSSSILTVPCFFLRPLYYCSAFEIQKHLSSIMSVAASPSWALRGFFETRPAFNNDRVFNNASQDAARWSPAKTVHLYTVPLGLETLTNMVPWHTNPASMFEPRDVFPIKIYTIVRPFDPVATKLPYQPPSHIWRSQMQRYTSEPRSRQDWRRKTWGSFFVVWMICTARVSKNRVFRLLLRKSSWGERWKWFWGFSCPAHDTTYRESFISLQLPPYVTHYRDLLLWIETNGKSLSDITKAGMGAMFEMHYRQHRAEVEKAGRRGELSTLICFYPRDSKPNSNSQTRWYTKEKQRQALFQKAAYTSRETKRLWGFPPKGFSSRRGQGRTSDQSGAWARFWSRSVSSHSSHIPESQSFAPGPKPMLHNTYSIVEYPSNVLHGCTEQQ